MTVGLLMTPQVVYEVGMTKHSLAKRRLTSSA